MIADANVVYSTIQNVSANSKLLGSGQTGSGSVTDAGDRVVLV
jgi:hypothetical protein